MSKTRSPRKTIIWRLGLGFTALGSLLFILMISFFIGATWTDDERWALTGIAVMFPFVVAGAAGAILLVWGWEE